MGTPLTDVFQYFLARITADEWTLEEELEIAERDWQQLLDMGIFRFKYPRVSLDYGYQQCEVDGCECEVLCFDDELSNDEIQMLALYMKHEWIKRCIASWENIRQLYTDSEFSQANHLDKLNDLEEAVADEVHHAEGIYDRSRNKRPSKIFSQLAGKNHK